MKRPSFPMRCEVRQRLAPMDPLVMATYTTYPHEPLMFVRSNDNPFTVRWNEASLIFLDETDDDVRFRLVTCACRHCGQMYTFTEDL